MGDGDEVSVSVKGQGAADDLLTTIVGAEEPLIGAGCANAISQITAVISGADIAVVAVSLVQCEDTTQRFIASVVGARAAVVTSDGLPRKAGSIEALITDCADAVVTAEVGVDGVGAPGNRTTGIGGADVLVVAVGQPPVDAAPRVTVVSSGAGVPIVTGAVGSFMFAACGGVAGVRSAGVVIITNQLLTRATGPICADVSLGTDAAITAGDGV